MTRAGLHIAAAICFGCYLVASATGCIHDSLAHKVTSGEQQYDSSHPFVQADQQRRRLRQQGIDIDSHQVYDRAVGNLVDDQVYRPIRITPYYDNATLNNLTSAKRNVIFNVIPDAIAYFEETLSVVPVEGNLTASHTCEYEWNTSPPVCYSFVSNEACLEMVMPQKHFGATRQCSTCPQQGCVGGTCTYSTARGVPNTDFLLYVRAANTSSCSSQVLAYASSCQKDQYDRPTFGMVNFCPSQISSSPADYDDALATALHELTHALGFSSSFYAYMRHPDGTPRTPRDANGEPPAKTSTQCRNGNTDRYFPEPNANTVDYYTERGHSVAKLVTPNVAAYVQDHFNCSTLTGAELESNDPGCIGSHWEERLFESEYMSPVLSFRNVLSGLTLAFFEDSGWYRTNVSKAQRMVFGEKRGCSFATDKCIDPETTQPVASDHYCTNDAVESCSVDATSRSVCSIQSGLSIPSVFQYFGSDTSKGGANAYADYCPLNVGFSGGDCAIESNLNAPPGTSVNILGETYCPTCKCTTTSLRSDDSTRWAVTSRRATGCYAMKCHWDGSTVASIEITIPRSKSMDSVAMNCTTVGEKMRVEGFSGELTCPDPFIICGSTFATKSDAATGVDETQTTSSSGSSSHAKVTDISSSSSSSRASASGSSSSYDNMEVAPPSTSNPNHASTDGSFTTSTISNVSASDSGESQTSASLSSSRSSSTSTSGSFSSSSSMSNSESRGSDEPSSSSSISLPSSGSTSTSGSSSSGSISASSSSSSFAYSSSESTFADSRSSEGSVGGSLRISSSSSSRSSSLDGAGYTIPSDASAPVSTLEPISNSESSRASPSASAGSASASSASREGPPDWHQSSDGSGASSGLTTHATAGSINDSVGTSSSSSATSAPSVASSTDVNYGGVVSDGSAPASTLSSSGSSGVSVPISASSMSAAGSTSDSSNSSFRQSSPSASGSSASQTTSSSMAEPTPSMTPSPESSSSVPFSTLSSSSDSKSGEDSTPTVVIPIRETAAPRSTVADRASQPTTVPGPTEGAAVRSTDGNGAAAATISSVVVMIGIAMLLVQT